MNQQHNELKILKIKGIDKRKNRRTYLFRRSSSLTVTLLRQLTNRGLPIIKLKKGGFPTMEEDQS